MELRVLEYFLALTQEGSISAAAKALNVSQPTLSRQLMDLEKENYSEDDFAEAIIVLINSIQNSICDFHSGFADYLEQHPFSE